MALRELLATFGVEVDDGQLKGFDKNLKATVDSVGKLGKALLGGMAAKAIVGFIADTAAMGAEVDDLATKLGIGADDVQKFQYVVGQSGGSAELAAKGLTMFTKNLGEAVSGNKTAAAAFAGLGLNIKNADGSTRSIVDLLPEVADKIADTDDAAKQAAMSTSVFGKAGLELLPTLKNGADGLGELLERYDDLGLGLNGDFIKAAAEADDEFDNMRQQFKAVKAALMVYILPPITNASRVVLKFVGALIKFDKQTKLIRDGLIGLSAFGLFKAAKSLKGIVGPAWGAIKAFRAMSVSVFGMGVPLWLVIGALVLLYLAVDDIFALMRGDKSVIGDYLDEYGGAGTAAALATQLNEAWVGVSAAFSQAGTAFGKAWDQIKQALGTNGIELLTSLFVGLVKTVTALGVALAAAAGSLAALLSGDTSGAGKIIDKAGEAIFGKTTSFFDQGSGQTITRSVGGLLGNSNKDLAKEMPELAARGAFGVGQIPVGVPGSQFAGPPAPPTSINNEVKTNITIQGSADPQATAAAVAKVQTGAVGQANQDALNTTQSFGGDGS